MRREQKSADRHVIPRFYGYALSMPTPAFQDPFRTRRRRVVGGAVGHAVGRAVVHSCGVFLALAALAPTVHADDYPRLSRLADGVYAYEQVDPTKRGVTVNNLIVVTSDGVLVADGQGTVDNTKRLVADVATVTTQPIRYVV